MPQEFSTFNMSHCFWTWKTTLSLWSSDCLFCKRYFQHFKSFCSGTYFPALKQNLIHRRYSFKSATIYIDQHRKQNKTHVHLTRHYSTITRATSLFQTGNDLSTSSSTSSC
jgi:hypothetical protein